MLFVFKAAVVGAGTMGGEIAQVIADADIPVVLKDIEELFDTARGWARKLGGQAPLAVEQIKQVSAAGDIETGIEREKEGFARVFTSEDAREGIAAFVEKRKPRFAGK